jgi:hypothetical protein
VSAGGRFGNRTGRQSGCPVVLGLSGASEDAAAAAERWAHATGKERDWAAPRQKVSAAGAWAELPTGGAQRRLSGRGAGEIPAGRAWTRAALRRGLGRKGWAAGRWARAARGSFGR